MNIKTKRNVVLDTSLMGMIGLARKAGVVESGFEATVRSIKREKIAFVLIDESLACNSLKKIMTVTKKYRIPLLTVQKNAQMVDLVSISGNKILGMRQGGLAKGIVNKLNQENE